MSHYDYLLGMQCELEVFVNIRRRTLLTSCFKKMRKNLTSTKRRREQERLTGHVTAGPCEFGTTTPGNSLLNSNPCHIDGSFHGDPVHATHVVILVTRTYFNVLQQLGTWKGVQPTETRVLLTKPIYCRESAMRKRLTQRYLSLSVPVGTHMAYSYLR